MPNSRAYQQLPRRHRDQYIPVISILMSRSQLSSQVAGVPAAQFGAPAAAAPCAIAGFVRNE
jgi:hypothetical protein